MKSILLFSIERIILLHRSALADIRKGELSMDTKQMLKDGFVKKQVALLIYRDSYNGKEHIVVVDTPGACERI